MAKPKKVDTTKVQKCYHCKEVIESWEDMVYKKIPLATKAGIRQYNRQLHLKCAVDYTEKRADVDLMRQENSDWDAVYQYFRKEYLGLDAGIPLQQHEIKRLLGLRTGQYMPNSTNTRVLKRGYDFKVILITLKLVKPKVLNYLSTTNFANHKHKIDGILRFITSEINDVQKRMDMQKKSNEKLLEEDKVIKPVGDYTSGLKRKEKKKVVKSDSNIDLGGLL